MKDDLAFKEGELEKTKVTGTGLAGGKSGLAGGMSCLAGGKSCLAGGKSCLTWEGVSHVSHGRG